MNLTRTLMLLAAATCLATPLAAQQAKLIQVAVEPSVVDENVEKRIRTSVRIKMRAQSIAASACHLQLGIEPAALRTPMNQQIDEFEQFVKALTVGDADLGINEPEARKKTLHAASLVTESWSPLKAAAENIANGNVQSADVDTALAESMHVVENGHDFTAELVQQYANPATSTFAELFTIVIVTRQGMLAQKMSKQACMVSYSGGQAADDLGKTMTVFESTLAALRDGMPGAGIGKPPTPAISEILEKKVDQWAAVKPILMEIQSGAQVGIDVQAEKMNKLDDLMEAMLDVSALYAEFKKNN